MLAVEAAIMAQHLVWVVSWAEPEYAPNGAEFEWRRTSRRFYGALEGNDEAECAARHLLMEMELFEHGEELVVRAMSAAEKARFAGA